MAGALPPDVGIEALLLAQEEAGGAHNQTEKALELRDEIARLKREIQEAKQNVSDAESRAAADNATIAKTEAEIESAKDQLASVKNQTEEAKAEAVQAAQELKQIERRAKEKMGPVGVFVTELPHQQAIALVVGVLGVLSVFGPSRFTRPFLAITGSAIGGLMVGGCASFFAAALWGGQGSPSWMEAVRQLLDGTGLALGYWVWAVMLALGIVRWLVGFNCALWACVDEVEIDGSGRVVGAGSDLQKGLLRNEAPSGAARGNGAVARDAV